MSRKSILFIGSETEQNLYHLRLCAEDRGIAHQTLCLRTVKNAPMACAIGNSNPRFDVGDVHGDPIDFSRIGGVWARGFGMPRAPAPGSFECLSHHEWAYTAGYLLDVLRDCVWINELAAIGRNANRLTQMSLARRHGFRVPESLVTNIPSKAKDFLDRHERIIVKHISPGSPDSLADRMLLAIAIDRTDSDLLEQVRFCPTLLQENVAKAAEFRLTVVGDQVFCAGIESARDTMTAVDSRLWLDSDLTYYRSDLGRDVNSRIVCMLAEMGLVYGAVDLILTPANELVFLEVNPGGQWGFAEMSTGYAITEAIIDTLQRRQHA